MNKKIINLITISSSVLMLTSPIAMTTSQPQTVQAASKSKQTTKNVKMLVYKYSKNHKSRAKSMARGFVGTKASVKIKQGKVKQLIVHVDGSKTKMGKGQDVEKIVRSLTINGVKAKKANISKDKSKFDFVFSAKAFKNNGWAKMSVTINFGGMKMTEPAWIKFGKVSGLKQTAKTNKKSKKATKTSSKSKKVSKKSHK